jgi:hypothetical protein
MQEPKRGIDTGVPLSAKKHYEIYTSLTVEVDGKEQPTASRLTIVAPGLVSALPEWLKRFLWWVRELFSRR